MQTSRGAAHACIATQHLTTLNTPIVIVLLGLLLGGRLSLAWDPQSMHIDSLFKGH